MVPVAVPCQTDGQSGEPVDGPGSACSGTGHRQQGQVVTISAVEARGGGEDDGDDTQEEPRGVTRTASVAELGADGNAAGTNRPRRERECAVRTAEAQNGQQFCVGINFGAQNSQQQQQPGQPRGTEREGMGDGAEAHAPPGSGQMSEM